MPRECPTLTSARNDRAKLHDFVSTNTAELIQRARQKVLARPWPPPSPVEAENGIPRFLDQLSETLRLEGSETPFAPGAMDSTATRHGRELLGMGFTVSQVIHDYGDVCQAVTELAVEKGASITAGEFHTLNRCLDDAIAAAVTEYGRLRDAATSNLEVERMGQLAHEMRNRLQTAVLSFDVLKAGRVGIGGATGAALERSLVGLSEIIDNTIAEVRLSAMPLRLVRLSLADFVAEVAVAAHLLAGHCDIRLTVAVVDPALAIDADRHLLMSAAMNLIQNAIKFTPAKGLVSIRTHGDDGRVFIEVEDECGGVPANGADLVRPFNDQGPPSKTGLGLGLSISHKAVSAIGGAISSRNLPGKGCVFTIDLPRAHTRREWSDEEAGGAQRPQVAASGE
jgi:signal transduction histidine kinase